VILRSFIDTWVNPGWLVHVDFEFIDGTPSNPNVKVENLWVNDNIIYGDATQPINLPAITKTIDNSAIETRLKFVTTGHGQGNTLNAAEFSQQIHNILVNGNPLFSQALWRSNCGTNPCQPQNGTWQYNRAGWCPGADVIPDYYDITSNTAPGTPATLEYQLQDYTNSCSPNNPNCVSSGNCPDCNYNYNGHTEPHYKISAQLITYLNPSTGIKNVNRSSELSLFPNPSHGSFTLTIPNKYQKATVEIINILGDLIWSRQLPAGNNIVELSNLTSGMYFVSVRNDKFNSISKLIIER
jgi:hypothetical protein